MSDDWERVDEDPDAETKDTRIRVEAGDHGTYKIIRQRYGLIEFPSHDGEEQVERYDWFEEDSLVLHSKYEAEQVAQMLRKAGAFDPNVLFFRQRDHDDPE